MPIFTTKSPKNPAVSWADLGWQRPGLDFTDKKGFSAWRSGIYSSSKYVWGQKIGIQWSDLLRKMIIMRFILVYHCQWGCMGYTVTPCLSGDAILPNCSTHRQSPHHSGSDFAQVLQNESPIFWNSTHTRPEFIKHPDRSCVVRLLGMERAKELPLALRTHKSQNLWVIP